MMTAFGETGYAAHLVNKMHKNPTFFYKIFSFHFLNLGVVFYPSKLFVPTREPTRGSITPAWWMAVHMEGDKSFCQFKKITNSPVPTGNNTVL